jgi:hypothetical protein
MRAATRRWFQAMGSRALVVLAVALYATLSAADPGDEDDDGILEDGDLSGVEGDAPCVGGEIDDCDDNCPGAANSDQADLDFDGIGDACDLDTDGDGLSNEDEDTYGSDPEVPDTDGDGIEDGEEVDAGMDPTSTDSDGDLAEDGDEIEYGTDPTDADSDGDGVPDGQESNWNQPMEGGDGSICALTPDCDGDGIEDGEEGGFDGGDDPGCRSLSPGAIVDTIGTIGNTVSYFGWGVSIGSLGFGEGVASTTYITPEGLFTRVTLGSEIYVPPDWAKYGNSIFMGVLTGRNDAWVHIDDLSDLTSYEMAFTAMFASVGITIFVRDDTPYTGSYTFSRSVQFSTGVGISVSIFGLPFGFPFAFSISDETHLALGFVAGEQFSEAQCEALRAARDSRTNTMEVVTDALRNHQTDRVGTEGVLMEDALASLADMLEGMGAEEGRGPEDGIPALSNGDLFGEFMDREATGLVPLDETADTSLDALLTRTYTTMTDNADDFDDMAVIGAVVDSVASDAQWIVPDFGGLNDQIRAAPAVTESLMAANNLANFKAAWPDEPEPDVIELSGAVGDAIPITVTVDELLDRYPELDADMLEGADVVFESLPSIDASPFPITDGEVAVTMTRETAATLLLSVTLDAGTLAEPLPGDLADRNLAFDYRLATVEPGPPAQILLQTPPRVEAGAEIRATAIVADEYGNRTGDPLLDVDLTGPRGEILNAEPIPAVDGAADLRIVPTATIPVIDTVYSAILVTGDGEEVPGYVIEGTGISVSSCAYFDGDLFDDAGLLYTLISPEQLLFAQEDWIPIEGEHELQVVNPGDVASDVYAHEFVE